MAVSFGAVGAWCLWRAFHPGGYFSCSFGVGPLLLGLVSLYFAWRALGQWAARRRRSR